MNALVLQFASANAKFVEDYNNARVIVDTGGNGGTPLTPHFLRQRSFVQHEQEVEFGGDLDVLPKIL